jgi:hypothetical protein
VLQLWLNGACWCSISGRRLHVCSVHVHSLRTWLLSGVDGSHIARISYDNVVNYASSGRHDCQASCACPVFGIQANACHAQLDSGCVASLRLISNKVLCCCSCCCDAIAVLYWGSSHVRRFMHANAAGSLLQHCWHKAGSTAVLSIVQLPVNVLVLSHILLGDVSVVRAVTVYQ